MTVIELIIILNKYLPHTKISLRTELKNKDESLEISFSDFKINEVRKSKDTRDTELIITKVQSG